MAPYDRYHHLLLLLLLLLLVDHPSDLHHHRCYLHHLHNRLLHEQRHRYLLSSRVCLALVSVAMESGCSHALLTTRSNAFC